MTIANFKSVREVSSEDALHLAENLLKPNSGKKWKTKTAGEKSAYVVLELKEPQQITGIDIGNEHSAFVEVLVGKAGCPISAFTEILLTSSFMTPLESRNSNNPNRVRFFKTEALVSTAQSEKWQLIKIVCSQPFNKQVQFGLSFITLHVVPTATAADISKAAEPKKLYVLPATTSSSASPANKSIFGKFTLREDSPDSESESTGALFNRWKQRANSSVDEVVVPKIKQASDLNISVGAKFPIKRLSVDKAAIDSNAACKPTPDRNRNDLVFDATDDAVDTQFKKQWLQKEQAEQKQKEAAIAKQLTPKQEKKQVKAPADVKSSEKRKSSGDLNGNAVSAKKPKHDSNAQKYRPFNQLLRGVTLVISGIQNPDRANLRSQALQMGAKYKTDWANDCTHLICAFQNTPKYNQVKGKGKIVTRHWIEKCYSLKKYLPWRRYALDSKEAAMPESDEEIADEALKATFIVEDEDDEQKPTTSKNAAEQKQKQQQQQVVDNDAPHCISSGSDTEDEIERVLNKNKENPQQKDTTPQDIYDVDTEEEDYVPKKMQQLQSLTSIKTN